jgi:hypothetical protein
MPLELNEITEGAIADAIFTQQYQKLTAICLLTTKTPTAVRTRQGACKGEVSTTDEQF